jgi:hypothetical protein
MACYVSGRCGIRSRRVKLFGSKAPREGRSRRVPGPGREPGRAPRSGCGDHARGQSPGCDIRRHRGEFGVRERLSRSRFSWSSYEGMMQAVIVLADFAEMDSSGKVHILGAGWTFSGPTPSPHAVVVFLKIPADRTGSPIPVSLRLLDKARQVVAVPGPGGMQNLEISGQLELAEPDDEWDHPMELQAAFPVNLGVLLLQPGRYSWFVDVDGKEIASTDFTIRSSPPKLQGTGSSTTK